MVMPEPELKWVSAPPPQLEGVGRRARGEERNQGLGSDPPLICWLTRAASQTGHVPYRLMLIVTNGEDKDFSGKRPPLPKGEGS